MFVLLASFKRQDKSSFGYSWAKKAVVRGIDDFITPAAMELAI
jgi:hypothetical protein